MAPRNNVIELSTQVTKNKAKAMMPTVINAFGGKRGFMKYLRDSGYFGFRTGVAVGVGLSGIGLGLTANAAMKYYKTRPWNCTPQYQRNKNTRS